MDFGLTKVLSLSQLLRSTAAAEAKATGFLPTQTRRDRNEIFEKIEDFKIFPSRSVKTLMDGDGEVILYPLNVYGQRLSDSVTEFFLHTQILRERYKLSEHAE